MPVYRVDAALGTPNAAATLPTSFTVTLTSGTGTPGVGEFVLIIVSTRGGGTVNTPSGWNAMTSSPYNNATSGTNKIWAFWRIRAVGDGNSVAFTASGGTTNATYLAQAYYFGGVDTASPIDVAPVATHSSATSATVAGPLTGVTTSAAFHMCVAIWHRADDAGTFTTASSGWSVVTATNVTSTTGTDAAMGMALKGMPSAGASGTFQLNVASGTAVHWSGIVFALKARTGTGNITVTAEGWTDEQVVTAQTATDPEISIVVGTGTTKADTAQFVVGGKSYRHDVAAQQQRFKLNCDIPGTIQYGAFFYRTTQLPSASARIASLEGYPGEDWCQVQHQSTGAWRIASDGGSPFSSASTLVTPVNTWVRIEWMVDTVAESAELRLFQGANLMADVSTPDEVETISSIASGGALVGRAMFGPGVANWSSASMWYDQASCRYDNWVNLGSGAAPPETVGPMAPIY